MNTRKKFKFLFFMIYLSYMPLILIRIYPISNIPVIFSAADFLIENKINLIIMRLVTIYQGKTLICTEFFKLRH